MKPPTPDRLIHASTPEPEAPERFQLRIEAYLRIGQVASAWSALEYVIDDAIWMLTGVSHELGACITSHLPGMGARLDTLIALIHALTGSKSLNKELEDFKRRTSTIGLRRNRAVHDPVALNEIGSSIVIRQVVKYRKLQYGAFPFDSNDYLDINQKIFELRAEFLEIRSKLLAELSSLENFRDPSADIS